MRHWRELQKYRRPVGTHRAKGWTDTIAQIRVFGGKWADVGIGQPDNPEFGSAMAAEGLQQKSGVGPDTASRVIAILKAADVSQNEHD